MSLRARLRAILAAFCVVIAIAAIPVQSFAHGENKHGEGASESHPETEASESPEERSVLASAEEEEPAPETASRDAATLLRNLHPATTHFAIALFVVAALVEVVAMARPSPTLDAGVKVLTVAGAIGAVIAALFGWIHTGLWFGGEAAMHWHRWLGTGTAIAGILAAWLVTSQPASRNIARIILFGLAIAVLVQGWLGGELAHGTEHLWRASH